jgi:hypothetical protein
MSGQTNVGAQATTATIDNALAGYAIQLRDLAIRASNLATSINSLTEGGSISTTQVLANIGYDNTETSSPGGLTAAAYAAFIIENMNNLAQVYYGNLTINVAYNYDKALAPLWGAT